MFHFYKILRQIYHDWLRYKAAELPLLTEGLADREPSLALGLRREIIQKIMGAYQASQVVAESSLPLPYHVGGAWRADIDARRREYLEAFAAGDHDALIMLFSNFFRNSGVAGTWSYEYYDYISRSNKRVRKGFITALLEDYLVWKDLVEGGDLTEVSAPPIGNPWGYVLDGSLIMANSFRHHYYAHKVHNLLSDLDRPIVAEIGGGYGGFAYYLLNRNTPCVYIGFDIPIILTIQSYYLMNAFPEKKFLLYDPADSSITEKNLAEYDVILMPHFQLPRLADNTVDLFINTNSLSEMDYVTVEEYLFQIGRTCHHYFLHENSDRDVSNTGDHKEVPASRFPIPRNFQMIYKCYSPWEGGGGRQREYLFKRV
jgi:putative sugar O-methyltransferase